MYIYTCKHYFPLMWRYFHSLKVEETKKKTQICMCYDNKLNQIHVVLLPLYETNTFKYILRFVFQNIEYLIILNKIIRKFHWIYVENYL